MGETAQQRATGADDRIVRAAIYHPGIGVARIGNSPDEYFIGPETVTPQERTSALIVTPRAR